MSEFTSTIRSLKGARNVAAVVGLLDSSYGIAAASYGQTMQLWGVPWLAVLTASVITVLIAYLVDVGLHANSLTAMRGIINGGSDNVNPAFYWWVGALCVIQLGFGVSSAVFTRSFAVDAVTVAPVTQDVTAPQQAATVSLAATVGGLDADIRRLERERNAALLAAGNATIRTMAANGNGWAQNELTRLKSKISGQYAKQIQSVTEAKTNILTTTTATTAATVGAITAENAQKWGNYAGKTGKLNLVLLGITCICTAVFLFTTIILAQYDGTPPQTQQEQPVKRQNKPIAQRTTSTGNVTDGSGETRYNAATDSNTGQQRNNAESKAQHGSVKFEGGNYHVYLHTPDGGAKWYEESKAQAALRTRKAQYTSPTTGNRDGQLVKAWMDNLAAGVAAIKAVKTQNAQ